MKFSVVFEVLPATSEFDVEWTFVDCNIPRRLREPATRSARGFEAWEARGDWAWEAFGGFLPLSLWDEKDVPVDVATGGKFVAAVSGRTYQCGNPLDGYDFEAEVEVLSYRKIGEVSV